MLYDMVCENEGPDTHIGAPKDAYELLERFREKTQEVFLVITLDGHHDVIGVRIITIGLLNRTLIHSREVFRQAIIDDACSIILAHNHPSGSVEPSMEDNDITNNIKKTGELVGIPVVDHIVFSGTKYFSYLEAGRI